MITKPEMTKKTSTPMKPPGTGRPAWKPTTSSTARARRPWTSARRCFALRTRSVSAAGRAGITAGRNQARPALQEPSGDSPQGLLAVGVTAVQMREDRDRDALVAAGQQRDLVVDPAGAGAPAALEVEPPAGRPVPGDAPALRGGDRVQQLHRVVAVTRGHQRVDLQQVARLIGGVDAAQAPDAGHRREPAHPGAVREAARPLRPDELEHPAGGGVVGAGIIGASSARSSGPSGRPEPRAGRGRRRAASP